MTIYKKIYKILQNNQSIELTKNSDGSFKKENLNYINEKDPI
jgi:hypothetical protein